MAALASDSSSDFFTFKFFSQKGPQKTEALILKITDVGVHVTVMKYGIEQVLEVGEEIKTNPETQTCVIRGI